MMAGVVWSNPATERQSGSETGRVKNERTLTAFTISLERKIRIT